MPRKGLRENGIEMGKQALVRKIPAARESVGHHIERARYVGNLKAVAEGSLVERGQATQISGWRVDGGGTASFAGDRSCVVGKSTDGAFTEVNLAG